MRSSRVSRDTSKLFSAIANRTRAIRSSTRASSRNSTSGVVVKSLSDSDSELSSVPSDLEDSNSDVQPSRKRKRGAATPATSISIKTETTSITSTGSSIPAAVALTKDGRPRKARKQPAKKKTTQDGDTIVEPPPNWERMYSLAQEVRARNPAPVDTMGCERVANKTLDPRDRRFQTLIALMLSSQTKDTVTAPTIWNMQENMPGGFNLESVLAISPTDLNAFIAKVGFHNTKTKHIKAAALLLRDNFDSDIPSTIEGLTSLPGVGPKMAYLCMSAAWGRDEGIGVDVHVHRITNLWGWHQTKTPEETRKSLEAWLPREKWHDINGVLVGLGQTICLPVGRKCGDCRLAEEGMCPGAVVGKIPKVKREVVKEEEILKVEEGDVVKIEKIEHVEEKIKLEVNDDVKQEIADIEDIGREVSPAKRTPRRSRR